MNSTTTNKIDIGSRNSPLARAQVLEVLQELQYHHPKITFECIFAETVGDRDRQTSLRTLGKTDFFTREIDELLLLKKCRLVVHSAKDLPDPIPTGITMVALTRGVDPSDSLVLREGEQLAQLRPGALIATSSERREKAVKKLRHDLAFIDIRGTIGERLEMLDSGQADGVVIAEAALIRLGLTHRNRIHLSAKTVSHQGQLAVMAREDDKEMVNLLSCIDTRSDKK